nr:reverse transcriptase domain-containing protein [Tanacetum cinerariifolium]
MIQQVQNSCQFHGLLGDDDNKHLDKFVHVTQSIKVNGVIDDALRLYLFPHSLTHHATNWFDRLPRNSINTFEQMAKMFLGKYFPPFVVAKLRNEITNFSQCPDKTLFEAWERGTSMKRRPEECYNLIENMTAHQNDWDTSAQQSESSCLITSSSHPEIVALKAEMAKINKNLIRVHQPSLAIPRTYTLHKPTKFMKMNTASSLSLRTLPRNTITNPKEDLKGITTRSGTAYQGPTIPTTSSSLPKEVERETKVKRDTVPPTNNGSTKYIQHLVVQTETPILNSKPIVAPIIEPVVAPFTKTDKSSINETPEVELKDLPPHLEYAFLEGDDKLPVIIAKDLSDEEKTALIMVLTSHKQAIAWKLFDIQDQMLERLARNEYYCFLDGFLGYFQISIDLKYQEKTTFTCPYGTYAYRHMPFGLCNAPGTFQRCMMAIFHDMIEKTMEVFMDDFLVFRNSFSTCLSHLEKMLKRCEDTNLCLNWEKSRFMVKVGIVLCHKISKNVIEVDKAKVDVIDKLPHTTTVKGIRSFFGHAGFYR